MAKTTKRFERVAFDVDSTLSSIEGIDELAKLRRVHVEKWTEKAMRGEIALERIYEARLDRVRPNIRMIAMTAALYVEHRVAGSARLIAELHKSGVEVLLISGALRPAILPLAHSYEIPGHRVYAVDVYFDTRGQYAGFDTFSPLARASGKRELLSALQRDGKTTAFIGDGATDLAAANVVDRFIAFTGVAQRPQVVAAARYVASSFSQLRQLLA
ncbi:MAG: HAD-IB family phosphatase [Planctomycetes bacterium]|nr:HAD-IB family phosphatase [Planctomycetota bacterium]